MGDRDRAGNRNKSICWKYLKRFIGIMGALFIFCGICDVLNYMYDEGDSWSRILWHNFYLDNGRIDNIYLGSSHVFCDINPMQLDDINEKYNFNMASPAQLLNGSYYLLKEADKDNSLSHVYLELYYMMSVKNNAGLDPIDVSNNRNWKNIDYMNLSYNKICYILSITDIEKYTDVLLPFNRYRVHLDDWGYIKKNDSRKNDEMYLSYKYCQESDNGYEEYMRQGYYYSTKEFMDQSRRWEQNRIFETNPMGEKSEKCLRKIICYCQERNIPITLFISPMDELELISTEHYDDYVNQIKDISVEYSVPFYDFNLAKEEYLPIQHGEYFWDIGHLNYAGASMFTPFFSEVVSRDMDKNEKYFYASYVEKLQSEAPAIYGFYYRKSEIAEESAEQEEILTCRVASNREQGMEYRIVLTINEEEGESRQQMIQDFSENKGFTIPADEHGICTIIARMEDNPEEMQTLEVNY